MKQIIVIALLFSIQTFGQQTKNILFLGNSYTYGNNLPQLIENVAASKGDSLYHDSNTPGGYTLNGHSTNSTSLSKIKLGSWDYVVLQEQSQLPSFSPNQVATQSLPYAMALADTIYKYNACGSPLFFMTWGRKNGDASNCINYPPVCTYLGMQGRLRSSYLLMGSQNNAPVSPVGAVWRDFIALNPGVELYSSDESHPNINGSYLAACTFYASAYHKSPVGAWKPTTIDSSLSYSIQAQANATVFDSLNVWGIDTALPPHNTIWVQKGFNGVKVDVDFYATDSLALDSVTWDFGNGTFGTGFSVSSSYFNSGWYTVVSKHWKNCTFNIDSNSLPVFPQSITENASKHFNIYPNPSTTKIAIETLLPGLVNYSIQTLDGKTSLKGQVENNEIDVSALSQGVYILLLEVNGKTYQHKLMKL